MKKQGLPVLLIFMMMLTPLASAFDQCAAMDMSSHLPGIPVFSESLSLAKNADSLDHQNMLAGAQYHQPAMDCDANSSCTLHICGVDAISAFVPTIKIVTSSYYSTVEYISPFSTTVSPDLRPPKFIL